MKETAEVKFMLWTLWQQHCQEDLVWGFMLGNEQEKLEFYVLQ